MRWQSRLWRGKRQRPKPRILARAVSLRRFDWVTVGLCPRLWVERKATYLRGRTIAEPQWAGVVAGVLVAGVVGFEAGLVTLFFLTGGVGVQGTGADAAGSGGTALSAVCRWVARASCASASI